MPTQGKRIWIGTWLCWVAVLHTVAGCWMFGPALMRVLAHGVFDSVGRDPEIGVAVWFMLFGGPLAMLGIAIAPLERSASFTQARSLGVGALLLCVLGVVLMPVSGFWLAFPPAIALLRRPAGA